MSFILALVMMFSTITTAYANGVAWADPGPSANTGTAIDGYKWHNYEFLRVSLYWTPKAAAGTPGVGIDGADWSSPDMVKLGTFDWVYDGKGVGGSPVWQSDFSDALYYAQNGNNNMMTQWSSYGTNPPKVWLGSDWFQTDDAYFSGTDGGYMKFPQPVGNDTKYSTTDVKTFFTQFTVLNHMLWIFKASQGIADGSGGLGSLQVWQLQAGIYTDKWGTTRNGTYLLTVEPGVYMPIGGTFTAMTLRDALNWSNYDTIVSKAPSMLELLAQSVVLEPGMDYPQLGLSYRTPASNINSTYLRNESNQDNMRKSYGIGAFMWWSDIEPIPVVNYYYDLDEGDFTSVGLKIEYETDEKTGEKTAKVVDSEGNQITTYDLMYEYGEIFARKADNAKKISNTNTEYTAKADDGGYQLVSGYMTNKEVVAGNLDIKNNSLGFYDINGAANITEQLKNHTGIADLSEEKVKEWHTSQNFATTVLSNQAVSGLSKLRHIEQDTDGGLTASFGNGIDSLQAVFLYVKSSVPIPPPPPTTDKTDEDITIVQEDRDTTVTKMYYDSEDAEEPSEVVTDKISIFDTYEVKDEELDGESYNMVEWVLVLDETDGEAEGYKTWEEVKEHQADGKDNN